MIPDRRLFDSWPSVLVSPDTKVLNTINAFFLHVLYSTELLIRISRIRLTKVSLYSLNGGDLYQKTSKILSSTNVHRRSMQRLAKVYAII